MLKPGRWLVKARTLRRYPACVRQSGGRVGNGDREQQFAISSGLGIQRIVHIFVLALSMVTKSRVVRSRRVSLVEHLGGDAVRCLFLKIMARGYPPWDEVVVAKSDGVNSA